MSKLSDDPEISAIHKLLDDPPTGPEIEEAITTELFTVQDVVRYLVSCFASHHVFVGHGTDNYWDEALEIVQAVMHLQPPCDDSTLTSRLTAEERTLIAKIAKLRIRHNALRYIHSSFSFFLCHFLTFSLVLWP